MAESIFKILAAASKGHRHYEDISVVINFNPASENLLFTIGGTNFQEAVDLMKQCKCRWNPEIKSWWTPVGNYDSVISELQASGVSPEVDGLTESNVQKFFSGMKELQTSNVRRRFDESLMNFPPLKGKDPYENYQLQDITRALNQNRFGFFWDPGLGKSYTMAALMSHLIKWNVTNRFLVFSTLIGTANLRDELLKFSKELSAKDIHTFPSMGGISYDDRDVFNEEKYPYKIIILSYDAIVSVANYYFDVANRPKTILKTIEKDEETVKELTTDLKESLRTEARTLYKDIEKKTELTKKVNEFIEAGLKKNKELTLLKDKLKADKSKARPSSNKKYFKNFMPIKEWLHNSTGCLMLDENHSLSNPTSDRSRIMNSILPEFDLRYEYTGTLADKFEKLYESCKILDRDLVGGKDYTSWISEYNNVGNSFSKYAINPNGWRFDKIGELNKRLYNSYGSKRKMTDCLDLPPNYIVPDIYIDMSPAQRKIYEGFSNFTTQSILNKSKENNSSFSDNMLNTFQYFQLAVDNPEVLKSTKNFDTFPEELQKDILDFDYNKDSTKLEYVDDIISDRMEMNQKGIIWYFHPATKDALVKRYAKYDPYVVDTSIAKEDLVPYVKKFLADPDSKIIIASLNIMNTSITCVECKYEVYVEKTYDYVVYTQSKGRIFRPGQTDMTVTYSLRYNNSIDKLQEENLKTKGQVLNSLLNKGFIEKDMWKRIFNMSKDDTLTT